MLEFTTICNQNVAFNSLIQRPSIAVRQILSLTANSVGFIVLRNILILYIIE